MIDPTQSVMEAEIGIIVERVTARALKTLEAQGIHGDVSTNLVRAVVEALIGDFVETGVANATRGNP